MRGGGSSDGDRARTMNTALLALVRNLAKLADGPRGDKFDAHLRSIVDEARDLIAKAEEARAEFKRTIHVVPPDDDRAMWIVYGVATSRYERWLFGTKEFTTQAEAEEYAERLKQGGRRGGE